MWRTLKLGFASLREWWENVKVRVRELGVIHEVRWASEKRDHLTVLQFRCYLAGTRKMLDVFCVRNRGALSYALV
ncbi:hypothetical protein HOLleu_05666 [Holothuria leucospilota]|uniref:Uncharacterized protein n=1 Tax=Holothuria leucospilota TaxID=206669 RepID=A0A9Q1CKE3_HOLLE|nr:hypothetical protein HOLleu_05666 [Holothuria leucospilota]